MKYSKLFTLSEKVIKTYGELHLNYLPTPIKKATLIKMLINFV